MNLEVIPENFFDSLQHRLMEFDLKIINTAESDKIYNLFKYEHDERPRSVTAYFNEETKEFNLLVTVDLFSFCRIEYISKTFEHFQMMLNNRLEKDIEKLETFDSNKLPMIIREKKIIDWNFNLPMKFEDMYLEISPNEPVEITNGSFIIVDYCNVEVGNSFSILYNIYRDEFFCEKKIAHQPVTVYEFDSNSLDELQGKLEKLFP